MTDSPDLAKLSLPDLEAAFAAANAAHSDYARDPSSPEGLAAAATVPGVEDEREVRAVLLGRAREAALELARRRASGETSP